MREWNFENDNGKNPDMKFAKHYVEHWKELKRLGHGLIFWGGVGSGKSYMAACIANDYYDQSDDEGMDETQDLNEARIYDRIRAACQPVQVKGESQRRANRNQMMEKFRGFFNVERKEGSLDDRD